MLRALLAAGLTLTAAVDRPQAPDLEFRSDVRMIRLDVSVVSGSGLPVAGLLPKDFAVEEDGEPVEIALFEAFAPGHAREGESPIRVEAAGPRRLILVLDTGAMHIRELIRARISGERFLRLHTDAGDWVRVIDRSTGRAWSGAIPEDQNRLVAAIRGIGRRTQGAWLTAGDFDDPIASVDEDVGEGGASASTRNEVFLSQFAQATGLLGLLESLLVQLSGVDGRKGVVLISPGFPHLRNLDRRLEQVSSLARDAATAIYFVDSRGLDGLTPSPGQRLVPAFESAWARSGGAQDLAAATGGFTARFSNALDPALSRVAAEMRTYYVLGYRPLRPFDGGFREVKVKVAGKGLKARTKKGYLAGYGL
jgi:VWFA-related protein